VQSPERETVTGRSAPAVLVPAAADAPDADLAADLAADPAADARSGWRPLRDVAAPAAAYLLGQALALLAVASVAAAASWPLWALLTQWDARFYLAVARSGYSLPGPRGEDLHAFFPGYPLAVHGMAQLTGLGLAPAALAVSAASGIALACGIDRLTGQIVAAPRAARLTAAFLAGALPLSIVFLMPYSEAMFCALAVWALVCLGRGRWLTAGACACAAGLVRPTGIAVVLAMVVAAATASQRADARRRRAVAACAIAPLGTAGYLVWAAVSTGRADAWSAAETSGWHTSFDFGAFFLSCLGLVARSGPGPMEIAILGAVLACVVAVAWLIRHRLPGHLVAYVGGVLALALGTSGVWNSKYRIMIPALVVVCAVVGGATARWRVSARLLLLVGTAAAGCWFSTFMLVTYPYAL
jgi:hypothetical protein